MVTHSDDRVVTSQLSIPLSRQPEVMG